MTSSNTIFTNLSKRFYLNHTFSCLLHEYCVVLITLSQVYYSYKNSVTTGIKSYFHTIFTIITHDVGLSRVAIYNANRQCPAGVPVRKSYVIHNSFSAIFWHWQSSCALCSCSVSLTVYFLKRNNVWSPDLAV